MDTFYHLYNRALRNELLFSGPADYLRCLRLLKACAERYGVGVVAYCLMPTHYHLVLRAADERAPARCLQTLFNGYVQAVNRLRERRGPLCEGRYRRRSISSDEHLLQVCAYVHLNPVRAGIVASPEEWPYSNYLEWVGARSGTLVDRALVAELAAGYGDYAALVRSQLPPSEGENVTG